MTVKLIGGALIMLAALMYGRIKISEERRKNTLAQASVELVREIRDSITHYSKPLTEIFDSLSIVPLEESGFLPICRKDGIRTAWEKGTLKLNTKMNGIMGEFAVRIGSGYRDDELELCSYTLSRLEKLAGEVGNDCENRTKLYRNIPPLAALSVILLVL